MRDAKLAGNSSGIRLMISKTPYFAVVLLFVMSLGKLSVAQTGGEAPRAEYYLARELYETGRMAEAAEGFRLTLTRSLRIEEQPWIDSIPPMVMLGESYFHVGKVGMAMEQYDKALEIALSRSRWIEQVVASVDVQPLDSKLKGINWFTPTRPTQSAIVPDPGQLTLDRVGGQSIPLNARVDSTEVLRTMGIALARRAEVLGPLAKHSPLAPRLTEMLGRDITQRAEWVKVSWRLLRGLHALSVMSDVEAAELIQPQVFLRNDVDYFMTPLALLQLGKLQWKQNNVVAALASWQDGTLIAARHEQFSILAETLQTLAAACTAGNRTDLLGGIQNASAWGVKYSASVQASGFAGAAELATMSGDWNAAEANSKQAAAAFRIRDVLLPRVQAQLFFANALTAFGQNRGILGQQSLESALKIMRGTAADGAMAKQIFQMQMVLNLMQSNQLQLVDVEALLSEILQEPGAVQWQADPLETIAAMTTSAVPAYATWLDLAERRGTKDQVIERMDRVQRQRFYEALPMGGRLFSMRAALFGPQNEVPNDVQATIIQVLQSSPDLAKSRQHVAALMSSIAAAPLPFEERNISVELRKSLTDFGKAIELSENQLHHQALKRLPLNRFVPFDASVASIQAALDNDDLMLGFVCTGGKLYGAAVTKNAMETWSTADLSQIDEQVKSLLSEIGVAVPSKLTATQATAMDATWRETASKLYTKLLPANVQAMVAGADRIVVVPDGTLWYLPFEMLPSSSRSLHSNWLAKHAVVYLPTIGSLPWINSPAPKVERTLHAATAFFSQDKSTNEALTEKLTKGIQGVQRIEILAKNHSPFASWSRLMTEQMLVTAKIEPAVRPFDTIFLPLEVSRAVQLGSWLETPGRTPARLIMPGFQTSAASSTLADGRELFIPACSLLYSGTRSVLLSRWPVGGRSSQVVLSRYLQELDRESPSHAWQRAAAALWADELLIADEPVLLTNGKETATLVNGQHPKLWSGYMVIGDSQSPPPQVP